MNVLARIRPWRNDGASSHVVRGETDGDRPKGQITDNPGRGCRPHQGRNTGPAPQWASLDTPTRIHFRVRTPKTSIRGGMPDVL